MYKCICVYHTKIQVGVCVCVFTRNDGCGLPSDLVLVYILAVVQLALHYDPGSVIFFFCATERRTLETGSHFLKTQTHSAPMQCKFPVSYTKNSRVVLH